MSNADTDVRPRVDAMPGHIQSIQRAVAVIRLLSSAPRPLALQEIADTLELPKATTHGIVSTLRHVGFVQQERATGRYRLDSQLEGLPGGGIDANVLRSRSMNWADSLAANTNEAVLIGIPASDHVEVIHHVFCPDGSMQRMLIGEERPIHATALGKVLLAHTSWLGSRARQQALVRYTSRTVTDRGVLSEQLRAIRAAGYAIDIGEFVPDVAGVAAPIRISGGLTVAAIAVVGPRDRMFAPDGTPRRAVRDRVVGAAHAISETLLEPR
jgi:DNA-binding IclR family transcriptional regulator